MAKDSKGGKVIGFYVPRKELARILALQAKRGDMKLSETLRHAVRLGLNQEGIK